MSDKETVSARLDIEVFVDCPHCGSMIDLRNPEDTSDYYHDDCGNVIKQACPDGYWMDEHKKFEINDVVCTACKKDFNVKGLDW